jgi:hypothetical protein
MKAMFVVVIAFLLVATSLCVIVNANPTTTNYTGPSSPDTSLPKINITLPENGTIYNQTEVSYSILINKPSSWFEYGSWNGQIFSVTYSLDNSPETTIAMKEFDSYESLTSKEPITLQGTLNGLSDGNHTFQVLLYGVSYYQDSNQMKGVPSNYYIKNNDTATFSINTNLESNVSLTPSANPSSKPTTTTIIVSQFNPILAIMITGGIIATLLITSLLLYRRHQKLVKFDEKPLKQKIE